MPEDGSQISVIIRCKDEERWIGHSIQSVIDRIDRPEIIIVDNESSDESLDICRMFEHHVNMNYISISNDDYSPGKALNIAVGQARYEYILIISAHCVLSSIHCDLLKNNIDDFAGIFGKQIPIYRGRRIGQRYIWSHFIEEPAINMISNIEHRPFMHNALSFYSKKILAEFPFNEKVYGKEDRFWAEQLIKSGQKILYTPNFSCFHHWTPGGATWKGIG